MGRYITLQQMRARNYQSVSFCSADPHVIKFVKLYGAILIRIAFVFFCFKLNQTQNKSYLNKCGLKIIVRLSFCVQINLFVETTKKTNLSISKRHKKRILLYNISKIEKNNNFSYITML